MKKLQKLNKNLQAELDSWICKDEETRKRKSEREFARYPKMIKEMGLDLIDTSNKSILEIGCGPIGLISLLDGSIKIGLDPLADKYNKYYPNLLDDINMRIGYGEDIPLADDWMDLIVIPNSLDHCIEPEFVIKECKRVLRPSGWLAVHSCINLASCHPHESHINNISYDLFRKFVDSDFETYHELTFEKNGLRYGWKKFEGKCGIPAFAWLGRLCTKGA